MKCTVAVGYPVGALTIERQVYIYIYIYIYIYNQSKML